jgi:hypothetical protein
VVGYMFVDINGNLEIRNADYIENEDPGFWGRNNHWIIMFYKFDTEDPVNMERLLEKLKSLQLKMDRMLDFCKAIGFDLNAFVESRRKTSTKAKEATSF